MKFSRRPSQGSRSLFRAPGFTILELLVATAIFALLATLLLSMTSEASKLWQRAENQKARRQIARIIIETMSRDMESVAFPVVSGATNSLQLVVGSATGTTNLNPNAAFWQATASGTGPIGGLAEVGYFVQWKDNRSALCRYYVPGTNADSIFSSSAINWKDWLTASKIDAYAPGLNDSNSYGGLLAENVLGLWITVYDANNIAYTNYDSRSSIVRPVSAEIGLAVIDPRSARRITNSVLQVSYTPSIDNFVTNLPSYLRDGVQIFKTRIQLQAPR